MLALTVALIVELLARLKVGSRMKAETAALIQIMVDGRIWL